jgi:hypothetical protein
MIRCINMSPTATRRHLLHLACAWTALGVLTWIPIAHAEPVVPGNGFELPGVGDDLEDRQWQYRPNGKKSSRNIDERERGPLGRSANGRWSEGPHRGQPDLIKRVPTPAHGLPGSEGSLLIRTLHPGIPGELTHKPQQDDLILDVQKRLGRSVPPSATPSCVTRVYLPPLDEWEDRSGSHFGFRLDTWGRRELSLKTEQYWPGIFINFRSQSDSRFDDDSAFLLIRANSRGMDIKGPEIKQLGWWTLGMSVCADGQIHYYASPGIGDLSDGDYLTSQYCYGYRCSRVDLFFFNVVTTDDGRTRSTPWIIDDPTFFTTKQIASKSRSSLFR